MVAVLDLSKVNEGLTRFYRDRHAAAEADIEFTRIEVGYTWGIVLTPQGSFVLCDEGVGSGPLADDDEFQFDGYTRTENPATPNKHSFGIMPVVAETLTVAEIRRLATERLVPLHEFIRVFGARLDGNYDEFDRAITRACQGATV